MYFTTHQAFRRSVGRWRHNFRKFALEIFQKVKNQRKRSCQILPLVTIQINSTDGAQHFAHAVVARSTMCYGESCISRHISCLKEGSLW